MANYGIQFKDKNGNNVYPCPFPVGAIYMSTNEINPKVYFGGDWNRISGCYLMAYDPNSTMPHRQLGHLLGSWYSSTENTYLSIDQIPPHKHTLGFTGTSNDVGNTHYHNYGEGLAFGISNQRIYNRAEMIDNTGGGQGHNHKMFDYYPVPTMTVNVWKRVA